MNHIHSTIAAVAALLLATTAQAIPAWRGWQQRQLSDGTPVSCQLLGDEHCHAFVASNGRQLLPQADGTMAYSADTARFDFARHYRTATSGARRQPRRVLGGGFPTLGTVKGLVVLAQFNDNAFQADHTQQVFHEAMNLEGCTAHGATGSARDYFISQSWGQFTPQFDVVGPVTLSRTMQYYGSNDTQGNDRHPGEMVSEACQLAHDSLGVDFSQYDYNDDGDVDFVYVIYAGYAESYGASTNTIWPHAANLTDMGVYTTLDGKRLQRYACSSELKYTTGVQLEGIGTFCHEFGHVLGLPDMYNTYQAQNVQLGAWDIMDQGSYNNESHTPPAYTAFERASLGWMELQELTTPADSVVVPELNESRTAFRITTAGNPQEFFTLENRQQQGWDAHQPGRGLMVIHVDYDEQTWERNGVNSGLHPRYDLVEADGTQGRDQLTDLYPTPQNNMLTDYSTPSMLAWDGTPTERGLTNIAQQPDGNISFSFMRDRLMRPRELAATEVGATAFTLSWRPVADAVAYRLELTEQLNSDESPVLLDEDFALMEGEGYPKSGYTDVSGSLDDHTHQAGWSGADLYEAGGYVRVGSYGTSGTLTTPAVAAPTDTVTLALRCQAYTGKTVSYTVTIGGTDQAQHYDLKATKAAQDQLLVFTHTLGREVSFTIATNRERLFIDHLRVLADTVAAADAWQPTTREWTADSLRPADAAAPTWRVEGLRPSHRYTLTLTALAADANRTSAPSEQLQVTTAATEPDAITCLPAQPQPQPQARDLLGRPATSATRGPVIQGGKVRIR